MNPRNEGILSSLMTPQSLLASLPLPMRERLAALPVMRLPAGAPVFDRNARCGGFPVLLSGAVRVFRPLANGRNIELYRVAPDEPCILSLACLMGDSAYPACGVTSAPTAMTIMPPQMFDECMATVAPFRTALFRTLGERLINVMMLVEEVVSLRLDVRLAAALMAHRGSGSAPILITHQQLADELGTVREMISRLLDEFAGQQLVTLARGRIEIVAPDRLRQLAQAR